MLIWSTVSNSHILPIVFIRIYFFFYKEPTIFNWSLTIDHINILYIIKKCEKLGVCAVLLIKLWPVEKENILTRVKICLSEGSFHHFIFILCVNYKGNKESIIVSIH